MSTQEEKALTEVMTIIEATEDTNAREQLAVLVASGRAKETTLEKVKRLSEKDVAKCFKRYEASLSST